LTVELQNQKLLITQLCKPITNGHRTPFTSFDSRHAGSTSHVSMLTKIGPTRQIICNRNASRQDYFPQIASLGHMWYWRDPKQFLETLVLKASLLPFASFASASSSALNTMSDLNYLCVPQPSLLHQQRGSSTLYFASSVSILYHVNQQAATGVRSYRCSKKSTVYALAHARDGSE